VKPVSQIAKQINAEKQIDTQSMVLVVRFDGGVRRGVIESDRRDDAISSCLFDGSRVVSTMRIKQSWSLSPGINNLAQQSSRCKNTNPSFETSEGLKLKKTVLLRKQKSKKKQNSKGSSRPARRNSKRV